MISAIIMNFGMPQTVLDHQRSAARGESLRRDQQREA